MKHTLGDTRLAHKPKGMKRGAAKMRLKKKRGGAIHGWLPFTCVGKEPVWNFRDEDDYRPARAAEEERVTDQIWLDEAAAKAEARALQQEQQALEPEPAVAELEFLECQHLNSIYFDEDTGEYCQTCRVLIRDIADIPPEIDRSRRARFKPDQERWANGYPDSEDDDEEEVDQTVEGQSGVVIAVPPVGELQESVDPERGLCTIPELAERMHPHQRSSFGFLWRNLGGCAASGHQAGGCILAHAPGTGKSLLIVGFLQSYFVANPQHRALIVAPKSMLKVWKREFEKWKSSVPVLILNYNKTAWKEAGDTVPQMHGDNNIHKERKGVLEAWKNKPGTVLTTNYQTLERIVHDPLQLASADANSNRECVVNWTNVLILDEGHFIRNITQCRSAVMEIKTQRRVLLSGTLFQNNVEELRNLCYLVRADFLDQGRCGKEGGALEGVIRIGSDSEDEKKTPGYQAPPPTARVLRHRPAAADPEVTAVQHHEKLLIQKQKMERKKFDIKCMTLFPALLRKDSKATVTEQQRDEEIKKWQEHTDWFVDFFDGEGILEKLPPLQEYVLKANPTDIQKDMLQEKRLLEGRHDLTMLEAHQKSSLICMHPVLENWSSDGGNRDQEYRKARREQGVKTHIVMQLLELCNQQNEKVIVFCMQVEPLKLLRSMMETCFRWSLGMEFRIVHGSMNLDDRIRSMDDFNQVDGPVKVMLASTKACGEGVSLVGASRVIHLDTEWNPAVNRQATCRAHRQGQTKPVFAYRLLACDTREEERYNTAILKDNLGRRILVPADVRGPSGKGELQPPVPAGTIDDNILKKIIRWDKNESIMQIVKLGLNNGGTAYTEEIVYATAKAQERRKTPAEASPEQRKTPTEASPEEKTRPAPNPRPPPPKPRRKKGIRYSQPNKRKRQRRKLELSNEDNRHEAQHCRGSRPSKQEVSSGEEDVLPSHSDDDLSDEF